MDIESQRIKVIQALRQVGQQVTARELSELTGLDYYMIQRRVSEIPSIVRTGLKRDPITNKLMSLLRLDI